MVTTRTIELDRRILPRAIGAAALGNMVEWFDFAVYLYIAATLGHVFFADASPTVQLLSSYAAFAVSFVVRPLGGVILGPLGDRIGRQRVLSFTIVMMGAATVCIGLIPGHATIGLWAPVLLLCCRLVQGFSTGGEYAGAITFVAEYAPDNRRGFYSAWLEVGTLAGFVLGAGVVTGVHASLDEAAVVDWGWRIPFLLAGPLSLVGLYLRKRLEDTPAFVALDEQDRAATADGKVRQLQRTVSGQWSGMFSCIGLVIVFNVGYYLILTYLPTYLSAEIGLSEADGLTLTLIIMVAMLVANPWIGLLSDRLGRKRILQFACAGFIVVSVPAFLLMQRGGMSLVVGVVTLSLVFNCFTGVIPSTLPALFPTAVRNGALSISYNVAVSLFGGTTPLILTALINLTGDKLMPAYWMMLAAVVGALAAWRMKESARRPLPGTPSISTASEARDTAEEPAGTGDPAPRPGSPKALAADER